MNLIVPPSRARLWCYRLTAMLLAPTIFFGVLEAAIWSLGKARPAAFVLGESRTDTTVFRSNPDFARKYFGPALNRYTIPFVLHDPKPRGEYRIFLMGGSAARGFPQPAFGMARQLETLLTAAYPTTQFRVINTAITASNSHVVREIAAACEQHEPDLYVVYLGNNEVVGPFGPGTVFTSRSGSRWLLRASLAARATGLGQLLAGLRSSQTMRTGHGHWRGMEMFLDNEISNTDKRLEVMNDLFAANLHDICRSGQRAGAGVLLCTVAVNEKDCAPFGSATHDAVTASESTTWRKLHDDGCRLQAAGDHASALHAFRQAADIDGGHAESTFRRAQCRWKLRDYATARELFASARDQDTLRFRADGRINATIRSVAKSAGGSVHLVDAERALRERSTHSVPGRGMFYEHVHLRFRGNYVVARDLLKTIRQVLPEDIACSGSNVILSEEECAARLAFSQLEQLDSLETVLKVVSSPPFNGDLHGCESEHLKAERGGLITSLRGPARDQALSLHRAAVTRPDADWTLHDRFATILFRQCRDIKAAEEHWRTALQAVPHSPQINHHLAILLAADDRPEESLPFFRQAVRGSSNEPGTLLNYARALVDCGRSREADAMLRQAERLRPDHHAVHLGWAHLAGANGDWNLAITRYRKAVVQLPDDVPARLSLAGALAAAGRRGEAVSVYEESAIAAAAANRDGAAQFARQQVRELLRINSP